jgi:hypothetical protein
MSFVINGTSGATQSASFDSASTFGFKNRIINGAMVIDQRNSGASVTPTDAAYTVDRWQYGATQASKFTAQQNAGSVTPPTGFKNYLGMTVASAVTVGAGDIFQILQSVEGFNAADLGWGAAGASTVTLSFWVRSSLTGTFGGALTNSAFNRTYPFTYTISAANTWEQKSVTVAGDTSGTWLTTNGIGISVRFGLGVGSTYSGTAGSWAGTGYVSATGATSVVGTNGATFYITGVQLEKSSTATSFDYRPYGTELALCQRYYYRETAGNSYSSFSSGVVESTTTTSGFTRSLPVPMRATPTCNYLTCRVWDGSAGPVATSLGTNWSSINTWGTSLNASGGGLTVGRAAILQANGTTNSYIDASSEL